MNECIKHMYYIHNVLLFNLKKKEILPEATAWMGLAEARLSDIRCRRRTDTGDLVYVRNTHSPLQEAEWISDCQRLGRAAGFAKNGCSISVTQAA